MKTIILFKLFVSVLFMSFIESEFVDPNDFQKSVEQKFNDLRKVKEINFKSCCKQKGIPKECSQFCTYDFQAFSDPLKLATTLNPGWFLVHYFLPGKCYLSELEHFLPCSIEHKDVTECCKNVTKIHELIETFPQMAEFKAYLPKQSDIINDPKWCQKICAGETFEITPRNVLSCSSTIKAALVCYWHGNADTVIKGLTGISADKLKNIYDYVQEKGIPDTVSKVEEMLKVMDPEVVKTLMEKPEILVQGLKQVGASQNQISKVQEIMNQIIQKQQQRQRNI